MFQIDVTCLVLLHDIGRAGIQPQQFVVSGHLKSVPDGANLSYSHVVVNALLFRNFTIYNPCLHFL